MNIGVGNRLRLRVSNDSVLQTARTTGLWSTFQVNVRMSVTAKNVRDIVTSLTTRTCEGDVDMNVIDDAHVTIKSVACDDISVVRQSGTLQCVGAFDDAAAITASNLLNAAVSASSGPLEVPASVGTDTRVVMTTYTGINEFLNFNCGNTNQVQNIMRDVTVNLEGVDCDTLQVFSQKASVHISCLQHLASAIADANSLNTAAEASPSRTGVQAFFHDNWVLVVLSAVLLAIIVAIVAATHHRMR